MESANCDPRHLTKKYLVIPLDIFGRNIQNKGIRNETEAWLAFLSQDDPAIILRLIDSYPEFKPMYEDVYRLCQNVEKVMGIFSEELRILDRNTVQYMIDEMQTQIDSLKAQVDSLKAQTETQKAQAKNRKVQLIEKDQTIQTLKRRITELEKQLDK